MKKNVAIPLIGFLWSFGNGLVFFALNYIYRIADIPQIYSWLVIVVSMVLGIFFMFLGLSILTKLYPDRK